MHQLLPGTWNEVSGMLDQWVQRPWLKGIRLQISNSFSLYASGPLTKIWQNAIKPVFIGQPQKVPCKCESVRTIAGKKQ